MIKILVDVNVVLDSLLARSPWDTDADAVVQAGLDGKVDLYLSAFSLPTIFYILRRMTNLAHAHESVKVCLNTFRMIPTNRGILEVASGMLSPDFEDNVQIASAMRARLDGIVTRDPKGFAFSSVTAYSPSVLLEHIDQDKP